MQDDDLRYSKFSAILSVVFKMQEKANGMTIDEIAEEISSSRRTAERIRDFILRNFHNIGELPSNDRFKRWGVTNFKAQKNIILGLLSFSKNEIMEIEKFRKKSKRDGNEDSAQTLKMIISKMKMIVNNSLNGYAISDNELQLLMESEGIATHRIYKQNYDNNLIKIIRKAILTHKKISFNYTNRNYEYSHRCVIPYGIIYDEKTYLLAEDNVMKYFDLNFIDDINLTEEDFIPNKDFNLKEYTEKAFGVYQEKAINVKIQFSKDIAKSVQNYIFHPSQKMSENQDGTVNVEFTASGKVDMCREFFKWGNKIKILEPQELKDFYKAQLKKSMENLEEN